MYIESTVEKESVVILKLRSKSDGLIDIMNK